MNNQAKIAELKKNIDNKFFPEALKPKLLLQIEKLEAEDKASENKGILPRPKPKQSKTSIANKDGMPKFVIGDIVVLKGETTLEKEIIDRRMNNKNQYVYKAKYVSKPSETGEWNENELDFYSSVKKLKEGDTISFTVASNKPEILVGKLEYRDNYGLFTVVDGKEYELKKLLEVKLLPKPKKPTVARTVKSELKKYYAHREIKTVTVIEDGKKVVYKGEDVLNGAQFLAKGGKVDEIATYYPIRAIVEVTLDNGEKVKPANGYHIKNGAKPIAELGAALATEEIINNSIVDYHNPRFAYAEGGEIPRYIAWGTSDEGWFIYDNEKKQQVSPGIFNKTSWESGAEAKADIQKLLNGSVNYTSGSGDFDYIKFLDFVQPKVAATLLENNVTLLNDYTIAHDGKEFEPVIIYKGIDGKANALSVGYFADNDPQLKLLLSIDFELHENEYHIRSKGWNINDVDMYAKGGWVKDHTYLNKAEAYEMRYAKGKNRKGYMEKGGPIVGRKAKGVSVKKIADMHNVTEKYLRKQLQRGQKVELEHTTDEAVAYAIAKDHIYENPDYYILLEKIEMKAKGGEVKKEWVVVKPNGYYSLNASSGGERFLPSLEMAYTYSEKEAKKLAEGLQKTSPNVTIKAVKYGTPLENDPYDKYAKGGIVSKPKFRYGIINKNTRKGLSKETSNFKKAKEEFLELEEAFKKYKDNDVLELYKYDMNDFSKPRVVVMTTQKENDSSVQKSYDFQFKNEIGKTFSESNIIATSKEDAESILLKKYPKAKVITFRESNIEFKADGGEVDNKGILPHPKPKRQGSQIFAKAAEIREPGEKWQEAVRRANLLLKK